MGKAIFWFRRDLRVADNPALSEAAKTGRPVIPLFIHETHVDRPIGGASLWWLHHSLTQLESDLSEFGLSLIIRRGESAATCGHSVDP